MSAQPRAEDPVVLLTRPRAASDRFAALLEAASAERPSIITSPVLEIRPIGDVPDLSHMPTLIFTSGHAVEEAARQAGLQGRTCLTVGQRTADLARAAGATATCLGPSVTAFLAAARRALPTGPCLHLRGVHTRGNLAGALTDMGCPTEEAIIYDQQPVALSRAALAVLSGRAPVILPLFSPRSAQLIVVSDRACPLHVIAISPAVAQAWKGSGTLDVVSEPTAEAMVRKVIDTLMALKVGGTPQTR